MRSIINSLFFLFSFFSVSAQLNSNYITGTITDSLSGTPLVGASIIIHRANTGTVSHEGGIYRTANLRSGDYLVEISFTGYRSFIQNIHVDGETTVSPALQPSIVEQEAVTVTGVSSATRLRQIPLPVAVIKSDQLLQMSTTNVINSITHLPGVNALTTGPAISKPFIRGLGYNRVITLQDGVRQEGQQWGDEHGIEIDDYSVSKIEVLKGPGSLMYGSDALAGVLNIQSQLPDPEGHITATVQSEYQTNARLRGGYARIGGTHNGFSFNVYGTLKAAADYRNRYDGYVFNSKFRNADAGAMLGYRGSWGHSYLRLTRFDQHTGIIEGDRDEVTGQFIKALPGGNEAIAIRSDFLSTDPMVPFQRIRHTKASLENTFNIGGSSLDADVAWQRNQRQEFGDPDAPSEPEAYFDLNTVTYAGRLHLPRFGNWELTTGINGMAQQNTNRAEETLIPDYSLFDAGVFLFGKYHRNKVTVSGGVRADNRHVNSAQMLEDNQLKFAAFTKDFSNISGSAGISYEATRATTLKFNIARGFRAPTLAELASNGAHEGTNRFEIGNRDLKSETSTQADVGVEIESEHISVNTSVFYNHINNFIFYQRLRNQAGGDSVLVDPNSGDELQVFQYNSQQANLYGAELHLDIHPHPLDWLHFEHTFSYTRGKFENAIDGTTNVPLMPAARYLAELRGNFLPKGKSVRNLYVSVQSDYTFLQSKAFTAYNTETSTPGYWLVDLSAGTDFYSGNHKIFGLYFALTNIGDIAYQQHLSRLKYTAVDNVTGRAGVYNMGRNFMVRLQIPLEFEWQ